MEKEASVTGKYLGTYLNLHHYLRIYVCVVSEPRTSGLHEALKSAWSETRHATRSNVHDGESPKKTGVRDKETGWV